MQWISEESALGDWLSTVDADATVAVDTEFVRVRTFFPEVALYQLFANGRCCLVDPIAISDKSALANWFESRRSTKLMHACSEDLEVFTHDLGVIPRPLADTQVAAGFLGPDHSLGYQNIVSRELGVEVSKSETRSDWMRRPLSDSQLRYAADDVRYLPPLWDKLQDALEASGRLGWFWDEMQRWQASAVPRASDQYYLNIKDSWRLSGAQLVKLRALAVWREDTARVVNRPRARVVPDTALIDIAKGGRVTAAYRAAFGSRFCDAMTALVAHVDEGAAIQSPNAPLSGEQATVVNRCRDVVATLGKSMNMSVAVLSSRRMIEDLVRSWPGYRGEGTHLPDVYAGWRSEVVLPRVRVVLDKL